MSCRPALAIVILISACGGDDDGGGGGGGDADAAPEADGGGGGGDDGPRDRVEGDITVYEGRIGEDGTEWSYVQASIIDPRPQYMTLEMESGDCRMWSYQPGGCGECLGLCDASGECVEFPTPLSAGVLTVSGIDGGDIEMEPTEYGYFLDSAPPADLFSADSEVTLAAEGGGDVDAFSLSAGGVDPIAVDLVDGGGGERDTLRLEDGGDLSLDWDPVRAGTRVRLEINSNNQGHGLPVDSMIECESDDAGSLTVPRVMIEAFPEKEYANICAGSDCPPSTLTRYRWDRASVGGLEVELRVEFRAQFLVVHEP